MSVQARSLVSKAPGAGWIDQWCLSLLARGFQGVPVDLRLWDGRGVRLSDSDVVATVVVRDRRMLLELTAQPAMAFGEGYASGRIEVVGDLVRMLEGVNRRLAGRPYQRRVVKRRGPSHHESRHNVHAHYDLGNDFYQLWLDREMVYTCAYFERPDATLEEAQRAKLDYVCRKLGLQPGQQVVEAGCGWGALALHMAREYGVTVRAYNISAAQLEYARNRAAREGLADRVTFIDGDYRSIDGRCDAFVSVGMLEHVGPAHYHELGRVIDRVLEPSGRGLVHFIGRHAPMRFNPWVERRIFPGAHAPSLGEVLPDLLECWRLSVIDVENLRPHYAATLRHWLERYEGHVDRVRSRFGEAFVRTWRLYLASSEACFRSGDLQLFQIVFTRAADDSVRMTRAHLYSRSSDATQ
jgi:cyclopropane-fatty-acyl-phospholipid synthase